jgi:hypothetical protein
MHWTVRDFVTALQPMALGLTLLAWPAAGGHGPMRFDGSVAASSGA